MGGKYFKLEELLTSSTARQKSIENLPSWTVIEHLDELSRFLDGLRSDWGSGINVNSGYRCEKLNNAVGGSKTSVHKLGYAADLYPSNGKFKEFVEFVRKWLADKQFDQALIEKNSKGGKWVHIGLYNNAGQQRKMIKEMEVK